MATYPQTQWNNHHHCGYTPAQLYIPPKYSTFKEEIAEYDHLNFKHFENVLLPKVEHYFSTNKVKQTRYKPASHLYDENDPYFIPLQYEIENYASPTLNHLLSLTLYTDQTALCSDFSSTFRAISEYESLDITKARNCEYYWMSRYLRETVQLFGFSKQSFCGGLKGPFFSGLSYKLVFSEFQLRLCCPTSTSYHVEVAINFANDQEGIIVQLNNAVSGHSYLHGFNCSWLSQFKEESECLFFGGHYRMKVEAVTVMATSRNYRSFFSALEKVNRVFNGDFVSKESLSNKDRVFINFLLFGVTKKKKRGRPPRIDLEWLKSDEYMKDTITSFKKNKMQIVLNLHNSSKNDYKMGDKFMHNIKVRQYRDEYKWRDDAYDWYNKEKNKSAVRDVKIDGLSLSDSTNLFRENIFKLFDNLKTIILITTDHIGKKEYGFSLMYLLSIIWKSATLKNIEIKAITRGSLKDSWLRNLWTSSSTHLRYQYKKKNFKIQMMETEQCNTVAETPGSVHLEETLLISRGC